LEGRGEEKLAARKSRSGERGEGKTGQIRRPASERGVYGQEGIGQFLKSWFEGKRKEKEGRRKEGIGQPIWKK